MVGKIDLNIQVLPGEVVGKARVALSQSSKVGKICNILELFTLIKSK